jgi:hypothetical protein
MSQAYADSLRIRTHPQAGTYDARKAGLDLAGSDEIQKGALYLGF